MQYVCETVASKRQELPTFPASMIKMHASVVSIFSNECNDPLPLVYVYRYLFIVTCFHREGIVMLHTDVIILGNTGSMVTSQRDDSGKFRHRPSLACLGSEQDW